MAAQTTTTLDETLVRLFSRDKLFEPCERSERRFYDDMEDAEDERPGGAGLYFEIIGATGKAVGNPAEGGDWTAPRTRLGVQCSVTSAQIDVSFEISSKFLEAAAGEGSFRGDAETDAIMEATADLFDYADRLLGVGHGTGRLAIVDVTVTGTTITCRLPERAFQLRPNQPIDFVNTDTGGTVQASRTITDINYAAGTFQVNSSVSVTAGWGVYQADVYGNPMPNGLRMIVDDGDFASSIFGQSRTAPNTFLNSVVMDGNGGLQDYDEHLNAELCDRISWGNKFIPTEQRCNLGIIGEWRRSTTPDRIFMDNGKPFKPNTGSNHGDDNGQNGPAFIYGTHRIPFVVDKNLPARELYALHKPSWRKHVLRKADWIKKGGSILHQKPAAGGETYAHAVVANQMMDMTISCRKLNAQGKLSNLRDRGAAGDSAS